MDEHVSVFPEALGGFHDCIIGRNMPQDARLCVGSNKIRAQVGSGPLSRLGAIQKDVEQTFDNETNGTHRC